jgi:hypothetical protein
MTRAALAAACLIAILAGAAAVALAAPSSVVTVRDGDDVHGKLDIARASLQRGTDGRLRAAVVARSSFAASDLRNPGGVPGSVCLKVWTHRSPGTEVPDWLVCATPRASGTGFDASVLREHTNGLPRKVAAARADRRGRTLVLRFSRAAIGGPRSLRFAAETVTWAGCEPPLGCLDTAPDVPATADFTVR